MTSTTVGRDDDSATWHSHVRLALLCVLIGGLVYGLGWAKYLWISIFISLGIGFTIRLSKIWLNQHHASMRLSFKYLLACLFAFLVWGLIPIIVRYRLKPDLIAANFVDYLSILLVGCLTMALVTYLYYRSEQTFRLQQALDKAELDRVNKDKIIIETQLRLLQSQIEPHFLFNTLANVQALINIEPQQAKKMLAALTSLLRQSLNRTRDEWLTLGDELRFNKAYLAIQQIRLGERLNIDYDISDKVHDKMLFPPMLLQPLIENAVQHGIEPLQTGGQLFLQLRVYPDKLFIKVENDCSSHASGRKGHNIGLSNIRERLKHIYGDQATLEYDSSQPNRVSVCMEVPLDVASV